MEEEISGQDLQKIEKSDIKTWGIRNFADRQRLFESIQELINDGMDIGSV